MVNIMEINPINKSSKKKRRWFDLAKRAACESTYGNIRHGAIVVKGGKIVGFGFNKSNHTQFGQRFRCPNKGHATMHAEINAILGLPRSTTEGADIYIVRVNKVHQWRMSKPCPMCEEALRFVGVKRAFYTLEDGKHYGSHKIGSW